MCYTLSNNLKYDKKHPSSALAKQRAEFSQKELERAGSLSEARAKAAEKRAADAASALERAGLCGRTTVKSQKRRTGFE